MTLALITGGSGHVGANLSRELINQGYKVRCIDFDRDYRAFENLDIELVKGDITDKDSLKPAFKDVEIVFHTAAFISLDKRYKNQIRKINVEGTKNVCEASVDANIKKLVHFSSIDAFQREPMDEPLYESRSLVSDAKSIPYDLSKADGQRIVLDFTKNFLDASIIHPTSIMGPNDFKPGLNCQSMIDIANQKRLLNITFGYNYVDVRDLSKTAINCSIKGANGQNYLVGGEFLMFPEIAKMIGELLDRRTLIAALPISSMYFNVPYEIVKSRFTKKPRLMTIDTIHTIKTAHKLIPCTLAKNELGHKNRPFIETITDTINFFIDRGLIKN